MASSLTTDVHGVRVVTQIIPLLSPESVCCPNEKKNKKTEAAEAPYMTRMFLKGEPVALGTVQVMIGIIMIAIGAITWFIQNQVKILYVEIPVGLGLSFICSGSVTLSAHKGTCPPIIKSAIALNIISALLAMSGICYFCFAFTVQPALGSCTNLDDSYDSRYYYDCNYTAYSIKELSYGIKGILLILSVLEVCVCTTTVIFSCKANAQSTKTDQGKVVQGKCSSKEALLNTEVASLSAFEP